MNELREDKQSNNLLQKIVLSFKTYYIGNWQKAFDFKGYANRKEYWLFILWNTVIFILLFFLDYSLGLIKNYRGQIHGLMSSIYNLLVLLPSLSLFIRRLHDIGESAIRFFVVLILVFVCSMLYGISQHIIFLLVSFIGSLLLLLYLFKALYKKGDSELNQQFNKQEMQI